MPLPKEDAWFPAKNYGWGWGPPRRWQGWAVMFAFFALLIAGAPVARRDTSAYVIYSFALGGLLVAIAYWKGEKPGWSWGNRE
jgi:hypothetical protein